MPRTIRRRVRVGPDRVLHMQLPDDIEPGDVDVTVRESGRVLPNSPAEVGSTTGANQQPNEAGTVSRQLPDLGPEATAALQRVLDPNRKLPTGEAARKAAEALHGLFADDKEFSMEEFLQERREDDARRDKALGL